MKRRVVSLLVCLALAACGGKDGDKKSDDGDKKETKGEGEAAPKERKAAITSDGVEAKAIGTGTTDWTKLEAKADPPPPPGGKVNASQIPKDGIPKPMRGAMANFGGSAAPTGFRVSYADTEKYPHFRKAFQQEQVFEKIAHTLNNTIKIPKVLDIQLVDCGVVNAFYDPNSERIIMCYEIMDHFTKMFQPVSKSNQELGNAIVGATFFAFFHELGHALIDILDLPSTGPEEDAVDELATLILMEGGEEGVGAAMAGARWFDLQSKEDKKTGQKMPFWDEHAMGEKRFYNIACLVYGSNPEKYAPMVPDYLPKERAVRCQEDYEKKEHAWERLLKDHMVADEAKAPEPVAAPPGPLPGEQQPAGNPPAPASPPATPPPTPAAGDKLTCEVVVNHIGEVIYKEAGEQIKKLPPEQQQQAAQEFKTNIPMVMQQMFQMCQTQNTPQKARVCYMKADTVAKVQACDKYAK